MYTAPCGKSDSIPFPLPETAMKISVFCMRNALPQTVVASHAASITAASTPGLLFAPWQSSRTFRIERDIRRCRKTTRIECAPPGWALTCSGASILQNSSTELRKRALLSESRNVEAPMAGRRTLSKQTFVRPARNKGGRCDRRAARKRSSVSVNRVAFTDALSLLCANPQSIAPCSLIRCLMQRQQRRRWWTAQL